MFIIDSKKSKSINWPVTVETAAEGGKINKFTFTGTFKMLDDDEKELLADAMDAENLDDTDAATPAGANAWKESAVDNAMKIMTDWKGVVDENKTPIDFTRANLLTAARSKQGISLLRAINIAITEISTGARTKN